MKKTPIFEIPQKKRPQKTPKKTPKKTLFF